jgi:hypothetical protein
VEDDPAEGTARDEADRQVRPPYRALAWIAGGGPPEYGGSGRGAGYFGLRQTDDTCRA